MKYNKISTLSALVISGALLLTGCGEEATETAKKVAQDIEERIDAEVTKDNEYLLAVKNGSFEAYPDITLEEAFDEFFSSPTWKYFEAETGEHVVEFTGYCTYLEQKVKAKLQFVVDEESGQFEATAFAFNDVPQDELTKAALFVAVFEGDETSEPDPGLAHNDSYFIEKAQQSYIDVLSTDTIGNIFNGMLFTNTVWSVNEYGDVIVNGDYNGEIMPGEPSNLQFTLSEIADGEYTIMNLEYNGQTVPEENHSTITDILMYATSQ